MGEGPKSFRRGNRRTTQIFRVVIPSGAETGLKLIQGFTMPVGGVADFTVDFVLAKSIIAPPGRLPGYMLKPIHCGWLTTRRSARFAGTLQSSTLAAQPHCGT